ncbi:MAG TPA: glycosyltransferase [Acidimicrobiales bacterium]|nr:glycosyltransferase [Acidimicrobiales bacterium]
MDPESQAPAPAVVAVVVTCNPGPWFEQVLSSFAAQDYPNMSVLVVDAASTTDPTPAVNAVLPGAFVHRLSDRVGFGTAANEVRRLVAGASHYLLCHDDVVLAPDAMRLLVEEAYRTNSGITSPKFVQWDAPERLLAVGATTDRVGVMHDLIDPGELDQEQHDAVREILVAPSGVTLVRADLFEALGGFDKGIDSFGEDLDLSWRARVAGARVTVVPAARVMHLQASRQGLRPGSGTASARADGAYLREAHRIRTLLTCYRWYDLVWVLPLALLWILGESATRLMQGRPGAAWWALVCYFRGFANLKDVLRARRSLQRHRRTGDKSIRRLQSRGNARFRAFVRTRIDDVREGMPPAPTARRVVPIAYGDPDEENLPVVPGAAVDEERGPAPVATDRRLATLVLLGLAIVLLIGTRSLFGHEIPSIGRLPNTSSGIGTLWRAWWATWHETGVGVTAPAAPVVGLLALLGTALGGAVGTLQHVVVLAPLVLGPLGAYRAARWWGSRRGRLAATLIYAVCPIAYNSLARGHWGALVAYAAAPWILGMIGRLSGQAPFPITDPSRIKGRVAGIAVLIGIVGSVAPSFLFVVPLVALGLLGGSALAGRSSSGLRIVGLSFAATFVAVLLLLPWSGTVLGNGVALLGPDPGPAGKLGLGAVMRFQTGPFGGSVLGWALLVVAALPLFIGRGWRLVWAARLWSVAFVCFAAAWMSSRGWVPALPPDVVLTMAAASLALAAALGAVAFELDLPGYRFGWRQLAAAVAAAAMVAAAIPLLGAAGSGRWKVPSADAGSLLGFLADPHQGDYRVLWVGAPDALPIAGYQLHPGIAFATSFDGLPGVPDLWVSGRRGAVPALASILQLVEDRSTTKAGHLLALAGVRYLVIPNRTSPAGSGGSAVPVPAALLQGLKLQTDLQTDNVDPAYSVYLNSAWQPVRAVLTPAVAAAAAATQSGVAGGAATGSGEQAVRKQIQQLDLASAKPALTSGTSGGVSGPGSGVVPAGSTVYVGSTRDAGWSLHAGSTDLSPKPAFGWAMRFEVPGVRSNLAGVAVGEKATLSPPVSSGLLSAQAVEIAAWVAVVGFVILDARRRRRQDPDPEVVRPEWFTPVSPAVDRRNWRPSSQSLGADDMKGDEVWIDV